MLASTCYITSSFSATFNPPRTSRNEFLCRSNHSSKFSGQRLISQSSNRLKKAIPQVTSSLDKPESEEAGEKKDSDDNVSKTEKLAAMIGQNRETMKEKQEKILTTSKTSTRSKYVNLAVSSVIAIAIFLSEKLNPNAGANLLKYLQSTSLSPDIIGSNSNPTVIEFSAGWCKSCKDMAPNVFELEKKYVGRVNFIVIDGDNPDNAEFIQNFGVDGIPQFSLLDKQGKSVTNFVGFLPRYVLDEDLDALVNGDPVPHRGLGLAELKEAFNIE